MRTFTVVVSVCIAAAALSACSAETTAQDPNAPIGVQMSQMFLTVENRAGLALTDVDVSIVPRGAMTEYKLFVPRLENSDKRDIPLGDFVGRDGTPFSIRIVRPRLVRITAKDINNKTYEVEVPWQ